MTTVLLPREASQEEVLLLEGTSLRRVANFASLASLITRCARELIQFRYQSGCSVVFRWCTITLKAAVGPTLLSGNDVKLELQLLHCGLHKTSRTRSSDLGKTIIMAITVSGMKLESEAFGNQSFPFIVQ